MIYHALLITLTYDLTDLRRKPLIINVLNHCGVDGFEPPTCRASWISSPTP